RFFFLPSASRRGLPSFPTRRSSDLNDMASLYQATRAGMGVSLLPHYLGGCDPLLRRVPTETQSPDRDIWLVVHPDLRRAPQVGIDRKSTRLNSSHVKISYAVFCLKK